MTTRPDTAPCQCWANPPYLHAGHCCFIGESFDVALGRVVCGHDEEGMRLAAVKVRGKRSARECR